MYYVECKIDPTPMHGPCAGSLAHVMDTHLVRYRERNIEMLLRVFMRTRQTWPLRRDRKRAMPTRHLRAAT
jgi:hypothetical protein